MPRAPFFAFVFFSGLVLPLSAETTAPTELVVVELTGADGRASLLTVGATAKVHLSSEDITVKSAVWSPRGDRLLIQTNRDLQLIDVAARQSRPVANTAAMGAPRAQWFSPDGHRLALPRERQLTIETVDRVGPALQVQLAADEELRDLLWWPDSRSVSLLIARGGKHFLTVVDAEVGREKSRSAIDCESLLGWRKGQVLVNRFGDNGSEVGTLSGSSDFHLLRASPELPLEVYVEYIAATDQLLYTHAREDGGDVIRWFLTDPGLVGQRPWLTNFSHAGDIRFSSDGKWAVLVDHSRRELAGEPGGDVYLAETATKRLKLLLRAGETTYASVSIRPRDSKQQP